MKESQANLVNNDKVENLTTQQESLYIFLFFLTDTAAMYTLHI